MKKTTALVFISFAMFACGTVCGQVSIDNSETHGSISANADDWAIPLTTSTPGGWNHGPISPSLGVFGIDSALAAEGMATAYGRAYGYSYINYDGTPYTTAYATDTETRFNPFGPAVPPAAFAEADTIIEARAVSDFTETGPAFTSWVGILYADSPPNLTVGNVVADFDGDRFFAEWTPVIGWIIHPLNGAPFPRGTIAGVPRPLSIQTTPQPLPPVGTTVYHRASVYYEVDQNAAAAGAQVEGGQAWAQVKMF